MVDPNRIQQALRMADIDGTGVVDKQEFMIALNSLDEQPSRMHIGLVQRQINVMSREGAVERKLMNDKVDMMYERMAKMEEKLDVIVSKIGASC